MFGKKMSDNDRFVMAAGRKAGNLKTPPVKMAMKGQKPVASVGSLKPRTVNKAPRTVQK